VDANVSFGPSANPDLFTVSATAWDGVSPKRIETVILRELEKAAQEPPTAAELATIHKQVKTQVVYSGDGVANLGFTLGAFEVASSYKDYLSMLDKVSHVTAEDVQRVAAMYLTELNRTVGWFIPTGGEGGDDE
jgi:predicted Zn-dependent peptidase